MVTTTLPIGPIDEAAAIAQLQADLAKKLAAEANGRAWPQAHQEAQPRPTTGGARLVYRRAPTGPLRVVRVLDDVEYELGAPWPETGAPTTARLPVEGPARRLPAPLAGSFGRTRRPGHPNQYTPTPPDTSAPSGEVLRERRMASHLSQRDLAYESGLSRSIIAEIERGRRRHVLTRLRLAETLDRLAPAREGAA